MSSRKSSLIVPTPTRYILIVGHTEQTLAKESVYFATQDG